MVANLAHLSAGPTAAAASAGGRPQAAQQLGLPGHRQVSGPEVRAGQDRLVGRVERDPRPRGLAQPAGQPDVIEVHMGDQDTADVRRTRADEPQTVQQRLPGFLGVPPGVDQHHALAGAEGIRRHIAKRVFRDGDGQGPQIARELLRGRHDTLEPGFALERAGDRQLARRALHTLPP
jgi:hypothetical protein